MFGRICIGLGMIMLAGCMPLAAYPSLVAEPITLSDARAEGAALARSCEGRDGWSDAAPPARIFGNTYYVGTCGISVLLVTSSQGHVLIDGATAEAAPSILANIKALGFDPRDVRFIVGSHEHVDHMGGFAALKAATGARLMVREPARAAVVTGKTDPADPQASIIPDMVPVAVDAALIDRQMIKVGNIMMTVVATPGHTSGGTSWTWRSCEQTKCLNFAYVDSLSAGSADGYRFTDHPVRVAPFRATFDRVVAMPCDILITPHPDFSNLFARLSGAKPLIDKNACRSLSQAMRKRLDDRLNKERAQ